jgi:hypothetical protein
MSVSPRTRTDFVNKDVECNEEVKCQGRRSEAEEDEFGK